MESSSPGTHGVYNRDLRYREATGYMRAMTRLETCRCEAGRASLFSRDPKPVERSRGANERYVKGCTFGRGRRRRIAAVHQCQSDLGFDSSNARLPLPFKDFDRPMVISYFVSRTKTGPREASLTAREMIRRSTRFIFSSPKSAALTVADLRRSPPINVSKAPTGLFIFPFCDAFLRQCQHRFFTPGPGPFPGTALYV